MPYRSLVTRELGTLLGVLSHPCRLRIIEELRAGEFDVNALQAALDISHSGVSQHLSLMRAHRLVSERREGRRVFYRLRQPDLAAWLLQGLDFVEGHFHGSDEIQAAVAHARAHWADGGDPPESRGR